MTPRKILLPLADDTTALWCGACGACKSRPNEGFRCGAYNHRSLIFDEHQKDTKRLAECVALEAEAAQMARDAEAWRRIRAVVGRERYVADDLYAAIAEALREEAP